MLLIRGDHLCSKEVNAGEEYRMRFNASDKNRASFKSEETEIPVRNCVMFPDCLI